MTNSPNGCESFMTGLRALGDGFRFFFQGLSIALRIWFAKAHGWATRPVQLSQWGMIAGAFVIGLGVLSAQHLVKMDFTPVEIALATQPRVE